VFRENLNEDKLLRAIKEAESKLKIYVYPMAHDVKEKFLLHQKDNLWLADESHFNILNLIPFYFSTIKNKTLIAEEKFEYMPVSVVDNPEEANAFVINYYEKNPVPGNINENVHNVIYNYPYFNRSYGYDHFVVSPWDRPFRCNGPYKRQDRSQLKFDLEKVSFISNYGMSTLDMTKYDKKYISIFNNVFIDTKNQEYYCHRPGHDIVIPQLVHYHDYVSNYIDMRSNGTLIFSNRSYETCFYGKFWGPRKNIEIMVKNRTQDYLQKGTEYLEEHKYLQNCLAMYDPCGFACWSLRKYDAILKGTIPIIISENTVLQFEKYLDWRKFTIKISQEVLKIMID